ncbi:MAG: stage sporulation protein, partial [Frankiales bacterium]|nr:stage sporulation protein [Frankiales bacterium]
LEMRVKSQTDPQALASAISHALYRGQEVVVRAIGERAIYQAQKAFVIAVRFTAPRGINLVVSPGWLDGSREPGDLRSEMSFRVFHFAQGLPQSPVDDKMSKRVQEPVQELQEHP